MSFSVHHVTDNTFDQTILKDESTGTEVAVLPGFGALLHAFRIADGKGGFFNVIDNYRDRAELDKDLAISYKSSKLSPFPCRIAAGRYSFEGQEYQFSKLFSGGSAIHGLLYEKAFSVQEEGADTDSARVSLVYVYKSEDAGYPFTYSCEVKYVLRAGGVLEVVTTVTNLDKKAIPIADGWHPYFKLGGRVDDWMLQFYSTAIVEFSDALIPTGALTQYAEYDSPKRIGDTFFDNCFVLKPGIVSAACELYNPETGIRVSFNPDDHYPYLQIYTPTHRGSIAVENLSAAPDSLNNKMGLIELESGHSQIFSVKYTVSLG